MAMRGSLVMPSRIGPINGTVASGGGGGAATFAFFFAASAADGSAATASTLNSSITFFMRPSGSLIIHQPFGLGAWTPPQLPPRPKGSTGGIMQVPGGGNICRDGNPQRISGRRGFYDSRG